MEGAYPIKGQIREYADSELRVAACRSDAPGDGSGVGDTAVVEVVHCARTRVSTFLWYLMGAPVNADNCIL